MRKIVRGLLEAQRRRSPHPLRFRLRRFRNWFFLGLLYAGYYLCRYNLGIVAPELKHDLGYSNEQYGSISSARDAGYAVGQFVNGLFADALGGKQSMAVGALGTIVLNVLFGLTAGSGVGWMLTAFVLIRLLDGYVQAFGAPGMIKVKTAWFERRERGGFSGVFGGMIQLGQIGAGQLGRLLLVGFTVPVIGEVAGLHWRWMFFVPPAILFLILLVTWFNVRNHPEEVGYTIAHDDQGDDDWSGKRPPLKHVFRVVIRNPLAWVNAAAYFCTGFVRRALEAWWVLYLVEVWQAGKTSQYYGQLVWLLPLSAFLGSLSAGYVSDMVFGGRRSPVAVLLYGIETVTILGALLVLGFTSLAGPVVACAFLTMISFTCNSSHSIIGAAVVMDIGGRKMSGFTMGLIDCFQYLGAILAGRVLGSLITSYGWNAFFAAMLPWSALGATLMLGVWLKTRGRDVRGG